MPRYDPFPNRITWNFTTVSSLASTTTDPISGTLRRISLIEGTVSDADWSITVKDEDAFVLYTNASVTANLSTTMAFTTATPYTVAGPLTMNVSNANGARTGTVRVYYAPA